MISLQIIRFYITKQKYYVSQVVVIPFHVTELDDFQKPSYKHLFAFKTKLLLCFSEVKI